MKPGDVLIDDYPKYRDLWEEAGGYFILYEYANKALLDLWSIYPEWMRGRRN